MIPRALLIVAALLLSLALKGKGFTFSAEAKRSMVEKRNARKQKERRQDIFGEDFDDEDDDDPFSAQDRENEKVEAKILAEFEKEQKKRLRGMILEAGGLKTNDALREEYSGIPNHFKRRDGLPGDEMADYMATYHPEYGITDERDLIDYLAS